MCNVLQIATKFFAESEGLAGMILWAGYWIRSVRAQFLRPQTRSRRCCYVRCFASASRDVTKLRLTALRSPFREAQDSIPCHRIDTSSRRGAGYLAATQKGRPTGTAE